MTPNRFTIQCVAAWFAAVALWVCVDAHAVQVRAWLDRSSMQERRARPEHILAGSFHEGEEAPPRGVAVLAFVRWLLLAGAFADLPALGLF